MAMDDELKGFVGTLVLRQKYINEHQRAEINRDVMTFQTLWDPIRTILIEYCFKLLTIIGYSKCLLKEVLGNKINTRFDNYQS